MLRLLSAFVLLASALAPVSAQSPDRDRPTQEDNSGDVQVGYLLTDEIFTRPSVLSAIVSPLSPDDRVRVVRYPDRRGWFEVYRLDESRLVGYAYHPYVSRFGPEGPLAPTRPLADASAGHAAEEQRPVSLPLHSTPGRQLPEVQFSATPTAGVRCTVRVWSNVRGGPGLGYRAFGVIRPGVSFQVQTMDSGWGKVRLEEQEVGYVSHALLDCVPAAVSPAPVAPLPVGAVAFPHIGELALSTASGHPPPAPLNPQAEVRHAANATSQEAALRALLEAAGVAPETLVYVSPTDGKFHRRECAHLHAESHSLPLVEAMMDHPPCGRCIPLTLSPHGAAGND